jgi:DNA-binding Lrp family transcriptional regulator
MPTLHHHNALQESDRRLIAATQGGLPLVPDPYGALAQELELPRDEVIGRLSGLLQKGIIRRIGVVPNHYALGYAANGMSVWDVADEEVSRLGALVGQLEYVTHCYRRPRRLPHWPYNLFAMVHARDCAAVREKVDAIAELLGPALRGRDLLFSSKILKKTGLRLRSSAEPVAPRGPSER